MRARRGRPRRGVGLRQGRHDDRAGISRKTLSKVEHGAPGVAIGTVFEVAALLGVPLFAEDRRDLDAVNAFLRDQLALRPERVHTRVVEVDDDF